MIPTRLLSPPLLSRISLSVHHPHCSWQQKFHHAHRILSPELLTVFGGTTLSLESSPGCFVFTNPTNHILRSPSLQCLPPHALHLVEGTKPQRKLIFSVCCSSLYLQHFPTPRPLEAVPSLDMSSHHLMLHFKCLHLWLAPFILWHAG